MVALCTEPKPGGLCGSLAPDCRTSGRRSRCKSGGRRGAKGEPLSERSALAAAIPLSLTPKVSSGRRERQIRFETQCRVDDSPSAPSIGLQTLRVRLFVSNRPRFSQRAPLLRSSISGERDREDGDSAGGMGAGPQPPQVPAEIARAPPPFGFEIRDLCDRQFRRRSYPRNPAASRSQRRGARRRESRGQEGDT
jgi:hypothetical protein